MAAECTEQPAGPHSLTYFEVGVRRLVQGTSPSGRVLKAEFVRLHANPQRQSNVPRWFFRWRPG